MNKINLNGFEANRVFIYFLLITAIVLISGVALSYDQNSEQLLPTMGVENIDLNEQALRETHFKQLPEVSGTGTYFKIENSDLNAGLLSSVSISVRLFSAGNMIEYSIGPISRTLTLPLSIDASDAEPTTEQKTTITLDGLALNTTYYMYEDSYMNEKPFTTDSKGTYSYEQDLSTQHSVWIQTLESNTYFIRDDATGGDCEGKSIGIWNLSTKTCTLTTDLTETVQIDSNNITLSCNQHSINGSVFVRQKNWIVIEDCNVYGSNYGIRLELSNYNKVNNNTSSNVYSGILVANGANNTFTNNNIQRSRYCGIWLDLTGSYSEPTGNNLINDNNILNGYYNGICLADANHNYISNNKISNISRVGWTTDGIWFSNSHFNTVSNNTISSIGSGGVSIADSSHNNIVDNNISNTSAGIFVWGANNIIAHNAISNSEDGIYLRGSMDTIVTGNWILNNAYGVHLREYTIGPLLTLTNNIITDNNYGVFFELYTATPPIVNKIAYNDIFNNIRYNFVNTLPYNVKAEYNWWGATDENKIARNIYDYFDYNRYGIVDYTPWLMAPFEESLACFNGVKDYNETDIDCGGSCLACEEGRRCLQNSDCISQYCNILYNICDVPGDLYIEWVKPIQVIEDVNLVAGKATVVRVKVVNNGPEVETGIALDYGNSGSRETQTVLIRAFSSEIVDFYSTPYDIAGAYQITAEVDSLKNISEINESNNTKEVDVNVVDVLDFDVLFVPAYYFEYGASFDDYVKDWFINYEFLLGTYPIPNNKLHIWPQSQQFTSWLIAERSGSHTSTDVRKLESALWGYKMKNYPQFDRVVGIVHENWMSESSGDAWMPVMPSVVVIQPQKYYMALAAHELGHTYSLCDESQKSLYDTQNFWYWWGCANKYPSYCSQNPQCSGSFDINGFWVEKKEERKTLVDEGEYYYSMMGAWGNNDRAWISDSDYLHLLKEFQTPHTDLNQVIIVSGTIDKAGDINFFTFYLAESVVTGTLDGNYVLELQDGSGQVIQDYNFSDPFFGCDSDLNTTGFAFTIPFDSRAHKIVGKYFNEVKDERIITSNAPTVEIYSPKDEDIWSGMQTINWNASDADGDTDLSYTLEYSDDNGEKWYLITTEYKEKSFAWNTDGVQPGNAYKIKVTASDGVKTGESSSSAFTIQNPGIEIQPFIWSFGSAAQGSVISKQFSITNSGNADLELYNFNAPANVVISGLQLPLTLSPRQNIQFNVELNTALLDGTIDENAVFYSNDPNESEKHFFIEGTIFAPKTMDGNLHLADMNSYLKEQVHYSGATSAQMILNYMREAAGYPQLPQETIYYYGHKYNLSDNNELLELDANAMNAVLGHFDPYDFIISEPYDLYDSLADGNPYQGYSFTIDTFDANTDPEAASNYMSGIAHWMAYPVKRKAWWFDSELVAKPNTPAAIPLYGNYAHWAVVNGFAASGNPVPNPSVNPWQSDPVTIYGFWLTDPAEEGIGQHVFVTAADANAVYFKPMDSNDSFKGKYLQIAEPPVLPPEESGLEIEAGNKFKAEIPAPVSQQANLRFVGVESEVEPEMRTMSIKNAGAGAAAGEEEPMQEKKSWRDLVDSHLLLDQSAVAAFEGAEMAEPLQVHELVENRDYYLVPFNKEGLTSGVIMLDAEEGYFKQASWTTEPEQYPAVEEQNAVSLVKKEINPKPTESLAVEFNSFAEASAQLAWQPNNYSKSPFKPYWVIEMGGGRWIATQEGKLYEILPPTSTKADTQVIEIATVPPESNGFTNLGKYFEIINPNIDDGSFSATLAFFYNDADNDGIVDGTNIEEQNLNVYYYKEEKGWTEITEPERNTEANTISTTTNHFTLFALMKENPEPELEHTQPSTPADRGSTGGGVSGGSGIIANKQTNGVENIESELGDSAKGIIEKEEPSEKQIEEMGVIAEAGEEKGVIEETSEMKPQTITGLIVFGSDKTIVMLLGCLLIALIIIVKTYLSKKSAGNTF